MMFVKLPLFHAIALSLVTLSLAGCGGSDSEGSGYTGSVTPPTPATPKPQFTLEATPNIPTIVNKNPATFAHSNAGQQALQTGIYKPKLISLTNDRKNCPAFGNVACPSFERVWIDSNNQIRNDSWAYLVKDKQWVQLSDFQNVFRLSFADFASDGQGFSSEEFDPQEVSWSPTASGFETKFLQNATFKLSIDDSDISGTDISTAGRTATYSTGAKGLKVQLGLTEGEYYYFEDADNHGSSGSSEDDSVYKTLEAYRAAHSTPQTVTCAFEENTNLGLVFNLNQLGATLYPLESGNCNADIDTDKPSKTINEYVKVIDDKKVLVLPALSLKSVVDEPFYNVITLNDNGVAAHGRLYQKGWAIDKNDYKNKVAMLDWLKTYNNETSALVLPPKTVNR